MGHFGIGRRVVSAHFRGDLFRPWVVSAKVYRNYLGMTGTEYRFGDSIFVTFLVFQPYKFLHLMPNESM